MKYSNKRETTTHSSQFDREKEDFQFDGYPLLCGLGATKYSARHPWNYALDQGGRHPHKNCEDIVHPSVHVPVRASKKEIELALKMSAEQDSLKSSPGAKSQKSSYSQRTSKYYTPSKKQSSARQHSTTFGGVGNSLMQMPQIYESKLVERPAPSYQEPYVDDLQFTNEEEREDQDDERELLESLNH